MGEPNPDCDLVIPCRDEERAIAQVLARVPETFHVIVVDNGSRDDTAVVAREHGAKVVREDEPGYGAALHAGVNAATADFIAVIDGDGSMDPSELPQLLAGVREGRCAMAIGRRRPVASGVWPWHARAGTHALAWLIRRSSTLPIHDLAPMRVCGRKELIALGVSDRRFGYPLELMLRAADAGWTVHEHDIAYRRRAVGTKSKVSGSVRGTTRTVIDFGRVLRRTGRKARS